MNWTEAVTHFKVPKVYQDASLENCNYINKPLVDKGYRWLKSKDKPSIFLSGTPGSGKTFFAYALLRGLIEQGNRWVIFIRSDRLDEELLMAVMGNQENYVMEKYTQVPFLFWDDLGTERTSDRILKQYYSIIESRCSNQLSTVFTSNLSMDDLHNPAKSNLGDRIASRLEMTYEFKFPDEDIRKKVKLLPL